MGVFYTGATKVATLVSKPLGDPEITVNLPRIATATTSTISGSGWSYATSEIGMVNLYPIGQFSVGTRVSFSSLTGLTFETKEGSDAFYWGIEQWKYVYEPGKSCPKPRLRVNRDSSASINETLDTNFAVEFNYNSAMSYGQFIVVVTEREGSPTSITLVSYTYRYLYRFTRTTSTSSGEVYFLSNSAEGIIDFIENSGEEWEDGTVFSNGEYLGEYLAVPTRPMVTSYLNYLLYTGAETPSNFRIEPGSAYVENLPYTNQFIAYGTFDGVEQEIDAGLVEWILEQGYTPPVELVDISISNLGLLSVGGNAVTPNFRVVAKYIADEASTDSATVFLAEYASNPNIPPNGGPGGAGVPSMPGGGGGTFPSSPGPSLVDKIPAGQTGNDIANSGMFTMYLMNQQYMDLMGDIFWEDNLGIAVLKEIFGNPIDSVISTTSYPFNLATLAAYTNQNLFFGPWNTGLPFIALTKSSFQIDWGTISIPFAWGNFLDYSPHTKMELFLPWGPGYVTIDPNDVSPYSNTPGNFNVSTFSPGSIQVKTNIELGKGTCVHSVIGNNGRVIGTYSGIVGKQVPLTALDTGGKALTTIGAVAGIVGGAAVGSLAAKGALDTGRLTPKPVQDPMRPFESPAHWDTGAISGRATAQSMVSTGANLASRAINSTPITFPRAGTFSDGSSAMTVQEPFLIISRPVQSVPAQYGNYNGYPSNIYVANLNAVSGYTELGEIHLDNVTATADELQELDAILKGGILL